MVAQILNYFFLSVPIGPLPTSIKKICKLENVDKVHLVRVVRLAGDAWAAKQIAKTIMDKLRL